MSRCSARTSRHRTIDVGDWRIVLWRADSRIHRPGVLRAAYREADLLWLDARSA